MLFQLFNSLRGFFTFTASYSNQVFKEPLSKEEEEEKIKKMQEGDITARNDLIEHNLRLVVLLAKKYDNCSKCYNVCNRYTYSIKFFFFLYF